MNKKIVVLTGLLFSFLTALNTASAEDNNVKQPDPKNGEILFKKAKCLVCHGTDIFTREDRKVNNLNALEQQIRVCDSQHDGNWYEDEIRDVVSYLNKAYYHFNKTDEENRQTENILDTNMLSGFSVTIPSTARQ